jgi:N-methylhydantoinase A
VLAEIAKDLALQVNAWFATENAAPEARVVDWAADLRYLGQSHELTVPISGLSSDREAIERLVGAFNAEHTRLYGYAADAPVELVTLRATARIRMSRAPIDHALPKASAATAARGHRQVHLPGLGYVKVPIYDREVLAEGFTMTGPLIVEQMDSTTVVFPDQQLTCDALGNLILRS